jgi:thioredoxin 1
MTPADRSTPAYQDLGLARADVEALPGETVLEFGANGCGWCQGAQPHVQAALAVAQARHPGLRHLKEEDGKGRPLGRSFGVKLWPTLVVLRDGRELARVVRPGDAGAVRQALATLDGPSRGT